MDEKSRVLKISFWKASFHIFLFSRPKEGQAHLDALLMRSRLGGKITRKALRKWIRE